MEMLALQDSAAERVDKFAATASFSDRTVVLPRIVRVRDGMLEWSKEEPGQDHRWSLADYAKAGKPFWQTSKMDNELLLRFVRLTGANDDAFEDFARRYGVLHLNWKGVPSSKTLEVEYPEETVIDGGLAKSPSGGVMVDYTPIIRCVRWRQESLVHWRDWVLIVRLLLIFGSKLRDATDRINVVDLVNDWELEIPPFSHDNDRWYYSEPLSLIAALERTSKENARDEYRDTSLEEQRLTLGYWLDVLANLTPAQLRVSWHSGVQPQTRLDRPIRDEARWYQTHPTEIFGDIVGQLLSALVGKANLHICDGCGTPYPCRRRRGFCSNCRASRKRASARATWHRYPEYNDRRRRASSAT